MKFLANENFPLLSVKYLGEKGYDIGSISELAPGIADQQVLELAAKEQRIILTFDRDYGELVYRLRDIPSLGVIYLRFVPNNPEEPGKYVEALIQSEEIALQNKFTVVERSKVRQRPLPNQSI